MSEPINNLVNITPEMPFYNVIADKILNTIKDKIEVKDEKEKQLVEQLLNSPQIKYITGDSYFLHYSVMPILRPKENPDKTLETARKVFKKYIETEDYRKLRIITKLNDQMSKIYSTRIAKEVVIRILKEIPPEKKQQIINILMQMGGGQGQGSGSSQGQGSGQNQQQNNQQAGQGGNQGSNQQNGNQNQQGNQQGQSQGQGQGNLQQKLQQALQEALQSLGSHKLQKILKNAMRKAKEHTETANELAKLLGGNGKGGTWAGKSPGSFEELYDLSKEVMESLIGKDIIALGEKIYSRMPKLVKITKKRGRHGDIYGYTKTRNIRRALPRELALPDDLFYSKLAGNGFTAREHYSIMEGSYYVLVDKSGSMDGEKTIWARSVALAIYKLAKKKGRKYYLRFFDYNVYELISDPKEAVRKILTIASDGGTNITGALETAIEDIKRNKLGEKTNTIILITDGEDMVDIGLEEELRRNNIQLIAIMIQGHNETLKELAEKSGGQYMHAKLTEQGALEVIAVASR